MLCARAKLGMSVHWKEKGKDTTEKKKIASSFATLRKKPPGLRRPGSGIPSSFYSKVEAQRQPGFQREAFCMVFAVLTKNGTRVPEKTTGHASGLTHGVPCEVLTGATVLGIILRWALPTL